MFCLITLQLDHIMALFSGQNIFSAFSPILLVLHCYKRPDTFQVKRPKLDYNSVEQPKLLKIQ